MFAIIDYGMGNVRSIYNAFTLLGKEVTITDDPKIIAESEAIILPGVGAFSDGMNNLTKKGLIEILQNEIIVKKKPYLGICLGLELLAEQSHEGGIFPGLGWLKGEVVKIQSQQSSVKVPHIGWDDTKIIKDDTLFNEIVEPSYYYLHSYHLKLNPEEKNIVTSTCEYGGVEIVSSIHKENIFATQFHPEKSQETGLKLLKNFIEWVTQNVEK